MLKAIWSAIGHTLIILRQRRIDKIQLAGTYIRLQLGRIFAKRRRKGVLRLFNYTLTYFDYLTALSLFEEIFVNQDYFFRSDTDSPVIIDCGSNIGMSVLFFKHAYPQCSIIAFEPDKVTFEVLKDNIARNHFQNVIVFNKALYSSDGTLNFYSDPGEAGSLMMSLNPQRISGKSQLVETERLSKYIESNVDLLKLDVEGAEGAVVKEIAQSGKLKFVRQMVVEYHHHLEDTQDSLSSLLGLLEANGFGYQIAAQFRRPFESRKFQDILVYCYQKSN
jgi:FkbM family methyltransferase